MLRRSSLIVFVVAGILFLRPYILASQANVVLLVRENKVFLWDLDTLIQTPLLNFADDPVPSGLVLQDERIVMETKLDSQSKNLYVLEGFGQDGVTPPRYTKIVRFDLSTLEETILFEKEGLSAFTLSPDNQMAIVTYYEGEFGTSRRYLCVLNITSQLCSSDTMPARNTGWKWIDNNTFVILSPSDGNLYWVDARTLTPQQLLIPEFWFINSVASIPNTHRLLISARQRTNTYSDAAHFLSFDLDTWEVSDFPYDALNNHYEAVSDWDFSPDGNYLLYGSVSERALVKFEMNQLIHQFSNASQAEWLPDSRSLLIVTVKNEGGVATVERFDLQTEQAQILAEDYVGYIIVPLVPLPELSSVLHQDI